MTQNEQKIITGTLSMRVSKEVVGHLSFGLYRNFARAIKELVSNSWDAGATEVKIKLDLHKGSIIVRDDGIGMDIQELTDRFLTIGARTPLGEKVDKFGRKRIGTFGIGCLSVFPYCDSLQVITKKKRGDRIIELDINTKQFFTEEQTFVFMEEAKVPYKTYPSDLSAEKGETIVVLHGIKPHIIKELRQDDFKGISSIDKYSGFQKFRWTLSQYAPIQFPPDRKDLLGFFNDSKAIPMRLWLDGKELFRNVPENAEVLEKEQKIFGNVSLKYAIMTTMSPIEPEEDRGIQIRLRNVAVGLPRDFEVTKFTGKVLGKLNYICGEAHILSGLDSSLMVDRDSFSYTQDVADISDFFREKLVRWNEALEKWAYEDKRIYEALSSVEGTDKVIDELKKANLIHISKKRLRLPKGRKFERKERELLSRSKKVIKALSKIKDYDVIADGAEVGSEKPPIKVIPEERIIRVYEAHPAFVETIEVNRKQFQITYAEWDPNSTPYSICKLSEDRSLVLFNTSHPLFESKLSDEIIKQLSLGIVLIARDRKDTERLLTELNNLLERTVLE